MDARIRDFQRDASRGRWRREAPDAGSRARQAPRVAERGHHEDLPRVHEARPRTHQRVGGRRTIARGGHAEHHGQVDEATRGRLPDLWPGEEAVDPGRQGELDVSGYVRAGEERRADSRRDRSRWPRRAQTAEAVPPRREGHRPHRRLQDDGDRLDDRLQGADPGYAQDPR